MYARSSPGASRPEIVNPGRPAMRRTIWSALVAAALVLALPLTGYCSLPVRGGTGDGRPKSIRRSKGRTVRVSDDHSTPSESGPMFDRC